MGVQIADNFGIETDDNVHRGQVRMAFRLAANYADRLLYVHGIGWHYYDGKRWVEDDRGKAKSAVVDVLRDAWTDARHDKDLEKDVRKCESASGVNGVLDLASALPAFAATVADLDSSPHLLNVANGTVDLRNLELLPHSPADRITKVCGASYLQHADDLVWRAFLDKVLPDQEVQGYLQRYIGVALYGKVLQHKLCILKGVGRNGKGVFYGAVAAALGDYAAAAEPDLFMHREGAHPTGEMDLRGRRFVYVSENDQNRRLAEATVKRLTGGDKIKARRMRQDFVEFEPSHTPALITNHLPKVRGDDPALWKRLRVVPFDVVVPDADQDPNLVDKIEADAVLTWAIHGWQDYQVGGLCEPQAVQVATDDYQLKSDDVARFIKDRCIPNPNMFVKVSDLWDAWTEWRLDDGAFEISKNALGEAFEDLGYVVSRGTGGMRIRRGLGLSDED